MIIAEKTILSQSNNVSNNHIGHRYGLYAFFALIHVFLCLGWEMSFAQTAATRSDIVLAEGWKTVMDIKDSSLHKGFVNIDFQDDSWKQVSVPHNWDDYYGYRRTVHGNLHGYAWYRKKLTIKNASKSRRYFLFFEGVGSYATVWVNGKKVGSHRGGCTTFTLDISDAIYYDGRTNIVAVRADHPPMINNLPWVCGGCSDERGFSEGSQPMGIFRPVHLIVTKPVRIEPFGVHIWNKENTMSANATILTETEIRNYSLQLKNVLVVNTVMDATGKKIAHTQALKSLQPKESVNINFEPIVLSQPHLWSIDSPYLYTIKTEIFENERLQDVVNTDYGIRYISWPVNKKGTVQFFLNGKPVFINGIAEYEHLLGGSHAFSSDEIRSRVEQIKAAGFNAFRDAHQPHNLLYQYYWNHDGILWWPQFSAHIWFDTKAFRDNFKTLLKEWIKERRNEPSAIAWGLQNESHLPADFAKECMDIIHELDPTSINQRMVNTCNGGEGTDWDVPQNWSGTYGGNPEDYGEELKKQLLVGEYGAWRSIDLHQSPLLAQNGKYTEDAMTNLVELKVKKAESVRDSVCGHFFWLYSSHDNPGRVQGGEGMRELDRIGPVNYKGLMTAWGEPLDVYYMFRANYVNVSKDPMVYIVSHNWPDRFEHPDYANITVYSNCDEVELFNDTKTISFGKIKKNVLKGNHFEWDRLFVRYNVLRAVGYVQGKIVAQDLVLLHHLPQSPNIKDLHKGEQNITKPNTNLNYIYRVNCGGDKYVDHNGNEWMADRVWDSNNNWGSTSWASNFKELNPVFASQRTTSDPIVGTVDWPLFQDFRYGRDQLQYSFPVKDGDYTIELYFAEPWFGRGGNKDCSGWRLFDVDVNGQTIVHRLDIWQEVGYNHALKKTFKVHVQGGQLNLSFKSISGGQAIISAIAIASAKEGEARPDSTINLLDLGNNIRRNAVGIRGWLNTGARQYTDTSITLSALPYFMYGAEWLQFKYNSRFPIHCILKKTADVYVGVDTSDRNAYDFLKGFEDMQMVVRNDASQSKVFKIYKKRMSQGADLLIGEYGEHVFVAAQPVTNILPAYDLKDASKYAAADAIFSHTNWKKQVLNGKDAIQLNTNSPDTLVFNFHTGVADRYALAIKYANPSESMLDGRLLLVNAAGTVLVNEKIVFDKTKKGKWNTCETNTGNMINAGNYLLKIVTENAKDLVVSGLEVR